MQLPIFFIVLGLTAVAHAVSTARGLHFIGIGYNILKGNPEGGQLTKGGVDPGLLTSRKIFQLTWNTKRTSTDGRYQVPDQVNFNHRASCVKTTKNEVISGAKSYQDKLKVAVEAEAGYDSGLWNVAFSLSSRYKKIKEETSVNQKVFFDEIQVCNDGTARYLLDLARTEKYSVTKDFAAAFCRLPEKYNQYDYKAFIDSWGTHVVEKVTLGTKTTTRYESSYTKIATYGMENIAGSVTASGGYGGFSASLSVDVSKFKDRKEDKSKFSESKVVFTSAGADLPEPIGIKLLSISKATADNFFSTLDASYKCKLKERRKNIEKVLKEYPKLKSVSASSDPQVRIPLTWPLGTYGLPMPKSGCPKKGEWHEGTRYHDTEDFKSNNKWSSPYDLAGGVSKNNMEQKFCMKTKQQLTKYDLPWPKGQYCIFKKGNCPKGFADGNIRWDDEDRNNENSYSGSLPTGTYDSNTKIFYCCRHDGWATNAINLPTDSPFVLFKYDNSHCQRVNGAYVRSEFFRWDNEDAKPHTTSYGGAHPFLEYDWNNLLIHYCYYTKKN